ncbi:hypothetical protein HIM_00319 [Hirsutella minnesotensis 3608]|nr:hypothetical protein HIM_00319 [Hirsutella minnesotensis 3608]
MPASAWQYMVRLGVRGSHEEDHAGDKRFKELPRPDIHDRQIPGVRSSPTGVGDGARTGSRPRSISIPFLGQLDERISTLSKETRPSPSSSSLSQLAAPATAAIATSVGFPCDALLPPSTPLHHRRLALDLLRYIPIRTVQHNRRASDGIQRRPQVPACSAMYSAASPEVPPWGDGHESGEQRAVLLRRPVRGQQPVSPLFPTPSCPCVLHASRHPPRPGLRVVGPLCLSNHACGFTCLLQEEKDEA